MTEDQKRRAARRQALRYRIWAFCAPRGWDVTIHEIAEEIGIGWRVVRMLVIRAGWYDRIRIVTADYNQRHGGRIASVDSSFSAGAMLAADIRREMHGEA